MIVEIQSVEVVAPVHKKQLLTYLRLADKRLGLLINGNAALIQDGIPRIVNGLEEESLAKPQGRQEDWFSLSPDPVYGTGCVLGGLAAWRETIRKAAVTGNGIRWKKSRSQSRKYAEKTCESLKAEGDPCPLSWRLC